MSNRIYDASHLVKRRGQQAIAGSFLTRLQPPNPGVAPQQGSGPLLGIYDASIMNAVKTGNSTEFTRYPTCIVTSQGCPCPQVGAAASPVPGAVTNIIFTVGSVNVSWDPPAGVIGPVGYIIKAYLFGELKQTVKVDNGDSHYKFTNLEEGKPYTFTVMAFNSSGTGEVVHAPTYFIAPPSTLSDILSGMGGGSRSVDNLLSISIEKSLKYVINHGLNSILEAAAKINWGPTKCSRYIYLWSATVAQAWNWVRPASENILTGIKDYWNWTPKVPISLTDEESLVWIVYVIDVITPLISKSIHPRIYKIDPKLEAAVKAKGQWNTWFAAWKAWIADRDTDGHIMAATNQPTDSSNWSETIYVDGTTVNAISSFPAPQKWTRLTVHGKKQKYLTHGWGNVESSCLTNDNDAAVVAAVEPKTGADRDAEIDEVMHMAAALTDNQKIMAEFWAGGPGTVSPPLMLIWLWKEYMRVHSATDYTQIIYSLLDLGIHLFEAGRMCWKLKALHMEARPIQEIRRRYHGQQITSWNGMVDGSQWVPYQEANFVTPPFADFPSGHSQFSKSFALTMNKWFGTDILKTETFYDRLHLISPLFKVMQQGSFADFLVGVGTSGIEANVPAVAQQLSYPKWDDIADAAGMSRLYGGIHCITAHTASQTVAGMIDEFIRGHWWNDLPTPPPPPPPPADPLDPPTLVYGLAANEGAYIYFTKGIQGTPVNYEYTTDDGTTFTALSPSDILSPIYIPGLTNDVEAKIKLRGVSSVNQKSDWSAEISVTPSNPAVPGTQLAYDPNNTASYNGGTSVMSIGAAAMTGTKTPAVNLLNLSTINRNVFDFSGSGSYISFGQYDFGDQFTISAWVYPRYKYSINGLLTNVGPNVNTVGFKVGWNNWQADNKVMMLEAGGAPPNGTWSVPSSIQNTVIIDEWQLLSYVFDKVNRRIIFYRNGLPVNTETIQTGVDIATNNSSFYIGAYIGGSYTMNTQLGLINIYNTALNAAQIMSEFNATRNTFGVGPTFNMVAAAVQQPLPKPTNNTALALRIPRPLLVSKPYTIGIRYVSGIPAPEIQALIMTAKGFIESIISESHGLRLSGVSLDYDMIVDLDVKPLADNILASARPTIVNTSVSPAVPLRQSVILNSNRFNESSLLAPAELNGTSVSRLVPVLIHEMLHGLGIAALRSGFLTVGWDQFIDSTKTWYTGPNNNWLRSEAVKAYREIVGTQVFRIPIENSFGQGTAYSHWEEGVREGFVKEPRYYNYGKGNVFHPALPEEIMTGVAGNRFYITKLTAGALADHGYKVNMKSPNIVPYPQALIQKV